MSGYADYGLATQVACDPADPTCCRALLVGNQRESWYELLDKDVVPECDIVNIPLENGRHITVDKTPAGGLFVCRWVNNTLFCKNHAVESKEYTVALWDADSKQLATREVNYHPDSSQHFYSFNARSFAMVMGQSLDRLGFYVFDGNQGVKIHPGVWHQPPIPLSGKPMLFYTAQSRAHNCVVKDLVSDEHKWWTTNVDLRDLC